MQKETQHVHPASLITLVAALLILITATACTEQGAALNRTVPIETALPRGTALPPDPAIEPPPAVVEQPLLGALADVPEVWLVPSLQSKEALAEHLRTDVAQLDWVNPGLPDEVLPGTLVVIPPDYLAHGQSERQRALRQTLETGVFYDSEAVEADQP